MANSKSVILADETPEFDFKLFTIFGDKKEIICRPIFKKFLYSVIKQKDRTIFRNEHPNNYNNIRIKYGR